ncbi:MAG: 23S rRNA (adenine(1618)-N(6))-methyltransferase RlmF [Flavobacteriaceae bacterium]|nr:23S rRNA (adenine(1618)-N(6))-methyltransferase RlmF [Flavobacteriaceae bacterium]
MHPKNPFTKDYNFDALIPHHPALKEYVFVNQHGNNSIKFSNNQAVKALNTALLKAQYGITYWNIPENNLCPPIPGRLDYLLHVADLLQKEDVKLLDIGTGANLIYPILASRHFNWQCTASEVDLDSLKNAQEIIANNSNLKDIELRHQKFKNSILEHIIQPTDAFDVVVCNPPFYKTRTDAERNNQRKVDNLELQEADTLNFGGSSNELWYKGGEEAFIKKMASESVQFKEQIQWFTVLVSQKEHLKNIKRAINKTKPSEVKIIDMEQGNKQSRFIAWTFQ